jgi:hypothetical protein
MVPVSTCVFRVGPCVKRAKRQIPFAEDITGYLLAAMNPSLSSRVTEQKATASDSHGFLVLLTKTASALTVGSAPFLVTRFALTYFQPVLSSQSCFLHVPKEFESHCSRRWLRPKKEILTPSSLRSQLHASRISERCLETECSRCMLSTQRHIPQHYRAVLSMQRWKISTASPAVVVWQELSFEPI